MAKSNFSKPRQLYIAAAAMMIPLWIMPTIAQAQDASGSAKASTGEAGVRGVAYYESGKNLNDGGYTRSEYGFRMDFNFGKPGAEGSLNWSTGNGGGGNRFHTDGGTPLKTN